jgi:four helix bundle protein
MCSYRQLLIWQQTRCLTDGIYRATQGLPADDHFDVAARMREAALAMTVYIASCYSRDGACFMQGLEHTRDTLLRLEYLVDLARRLNYWPPARALSTARQLARLRRHLQAFFY